MTRLKLYRAKLRAAKVEARQWAKHYNRAERALLRVCRTMTELEAKIAREEAKL